MVVVCCSGLCGAAGGGVVGGGRGARGLWLVSEGGGKRSSSGIPRVGAASFLVGRWRGGCENGWVLFGADTNGAWGRTVVVRLVVPELRWGDLRCSRDHCPGFGVE
mgnify:CR=1 FL=1